MNHLKLSPLLLFITAAFSCTYKQARSPHQSVYLFKDMDGVYRYDFSDEKETLVFKSGKNELFLDEPARQSGDTLTFGRKGGFVTDAGKVNTDIYYDVYYSVVKTGEHWMSKKVTYQHGMDDENIHIKTEIFAANGRLAATRDSSVKFESAESSYRGVVFNTGPRFFSKTSAGNKTVFSLHGDLYLVQGGDTSMLTKFSGHFDPKFGSGYLYPVINPNGNYVLANYIPGVFHFLERNRLVKIDLKSKNLATIAHEGYGNMSFSKDGNFLLFSRGGKETANDGWLSDIRIRNMLTGKERRVGKAYEAQWAD